LLATALLSIVRLLAEDRPLVLALDDAQWVDASSAELLRFVLRRLEAEPVGVLATVRGRPVEVPLELDRAFAEFRRLEVPRLSVAAIHRLLWGRLALSLPRPLLVRVHETVGGNPFFALELDGDRIRFSHPLLAPACYEAMPLHKRRQVHRRVAILAIDPEERARHLAIAATGPDEEIAAALDAAAAHAHARGAALAAA